MDVVFAIIRWCLFLLLILIVAGAGLEGAWLTCATGIILGLFLTVHPSKVKAKLNGSYFLPLFGLVVLFLAGSSIDMSQLA